MINTRRFISISICIIACAFNLSAQDDKELSITDQDVIKNFEAELAEAKRVTINPRNHDPAVKKLSYDYDITIVPLDLEFPDPKIRPLAKKPDPRLAYHTQWLKLGYGTLKRPIVDFGYQLLLEDKYNLVLKGNYDGGKQGDSLEYRDYDALGLALDGTYLLNDNHIIRSGLNFNRRSAALYGSKIDSISNFNTDDRTSNFIDFYLGSKNRRSNNEHLFYDAALKLNSTLVPHDNELLDHSELNIIIPLDLGLVIKEGQNFGVSAILDMNTATPTLFDNGILFNVRPYLNTHFNKVQALLGISAIYDNIDSTSNIIFPELELTIPLKENKYSVYAGSKMKYQRNNLRNHLKSMPYSELRLVTNTTYTSRDIYGGFTAQLAKLNLDVKTGYRLLNNRLVPRYGLIVNARNTNFSLVTGNAIFSSIQASYPIKSWLSWEGDLGIELFSLEEERQEDFIPSLQLSSRFRAMLLDNKALVSLSTKYTNAADFNIDMMNVPGNYQLDFSIDGRYQFTDRLGAFIEINNILGQEYQQWYRYADFNRNIAGGLTWIF